ncbi:hypothetical protein Afil01_63400 [Actinorhabdospora filicis]|uniref:Thioesterase TesA-like domain-containing protein n=1 Tax=Actinorhabdospora filicis TaxID=1785913 RepID=A0A9W6WCX8_9ACTN|nr:thioesterase domain-containing protein [Actinorhabdospora filicis]GLZ81533.1 hypothetical protein Afil01_63400 [Actinorhabdospora filicis]
MPEHSFEKVWATRRPDAGSDTLVRLAEGIGSPIFCFHTENGGSGEIRELGDTIRDRRPLYSTEAIGLHDRSTPPATMTEIVARHLRDIRRVQPGGPYRLLGLGAGGRLAHEAARQLHAAGEHTAVLAMVDTPAPGGENLGRHRDLRDLYDFRLDVLSRVFGTRDARALIAEMSSVGWAESGTDPTSFHWHQVVWAAARLADVEHVPVRYPGTAMLIQSAAAPRDLGWRPLVGQLRIRTVTAEGLRDILRDPRTLDGLRRVFGLVTTEPPPRRPRPPRPPRPEARPVPRPAAPALARRTTPRTTPWSTPGTAPSPLPPVTAPPKASGPARRPRIPQHTGKPGSHQAGALVRQRISHCPAIGGACHRRSG